jgi:hypothetical protein
MLHTVRLIAWPFLLPLVRSNNGKENASNVSSSFEKISRSGPNTHRCPRRQPPLDCSVPPEHAKASAWVEDNVAGEAQFFGNALVVEPRYVADLVAGMREAGLEVAS